MTTPTKRTYLKTLRDGLLGVAAYVLLYAAEALPLLDINVDPAVSGGLVVLLLLLHRAARDARGVSP